MPGDLRIRGELAIEAKQVSLVLDCRGDDDPVGRVLVVLGQSGGARGDLAGDGQTDDAGRRQGALNLLPGRHRKFDPIALFQQHDLPAGDPGYCHQVRRPDRGDHRLR